MSYLIGIDIGGTNLRAAVISQEGNIVEIFKVENEVKKGP
ncbi:MAG TPA: ROK family protein, partial [Clostridium sp.]